MITRQTVGQKLEAYLNGELSRRNSWVGQRPQ